MTDQPDLTILLKGKAATTHIGQGVVVLDVKKLNRVELYLSAAMHEWFHNQYPEKSETEIHELTKNWAKGLKFTLDLNQIVGI